MHVQSQSEWARAHRTYALDSTRLDSALDASTHAPARCHPAARSPCPLSRSRSRAWLVQRFSGVSQSHFYRESAPSLCRSTHTDSASDADPCVLGFMNRIGGPSAPQSQLESVKSVSEETQLGACSAGERRLVQSSWRKGRQSKICSVSWNSKNPPPRPRPPSSRISLLLRRDRRDLFAPHRAIPLSSHSKLRDCEQRRFLGKASIVHDPRRTMGRRL